MTDSELHQYAQPIETIADPEDKIIDVDARPVPRVKRAPQPGDMVSPDEIKDLDFRLSRLALWGYNFRQNLRVFFGSWSNLTKVQKLMVTIGTGTTGGVVGWVSGTWSYIGGLF